MLGAEAVVLSHPLHDPVAQSGEVRLFQRAFLVSRGRVHERALPLGAAGRMELESGLAIAASAEVSYAPEDAAALLVVATALRHPAPELRILPLDGAVTMAA